MKRKLLIVEDESALNKSLLDKFSRADFEVEIALDGVLALEKLAVSRPDIILLDIWLPRMDGFEFLEKMKADEKLKEIPVAIFSNLTQESDIQKGINLGASEYINKSETTLDELVEKVKKYCE